MGFMCTAELVPQIFTDPAVLTFTLSEPTHTQHTQQYTLFLSLSQVSALLCQLHVSKIWLKFHFLDMSWQYSSGYTNIYHGIGSIADRVPV